MFNLAAQKTISESTFEKVARIINTTRGGNRNFTAVNVEKSEAVLIASILLYSEIFGKVFSGDNSPLAGLRCYFGGPDGEPLEIRKSDVGKYIEAILDPQSKIINISFPEPPGRYVLSFGLEQLMRVFFGSNQLASIKYKGEVKTYYVISTELMPIESMIDLYDRLFVMRSFDPDDLITMKENDPPLIFIKKETFERLSDLEVGRFRQPPEVGR